MSDTQNDQRTTAEKVRAALQQGAYVSAISAPVPGQENIPIPIAGTTDTSITAGLQTYAWAHRFRVQDFAPERDRGLRATNTAGRLHFVLSQRLVAVPEGYSGSIQQGVPATPFDPQRSQAIALTDAEFIFDDNGRNRFFGFATGRTYPNVVEGERVLGFGANGEIIRGTGIFEGVAGSYVINGVIGPEGPHFQVLIRFQDSDKKFQTISDLSAINPIPDPAPGSTFMTILGREDPEQPVQQEIEDGKLVGAHVTELFSLVRLDFDNGRRGHGLRTTRRMGQLVGKLETDIVFSPSPTPSSQPTPFSTTNTLITFWDRCGKTIGTLHPNIEVGQGFEMPLPGFSEPMPSFRIVGFGPIDGGTGYFDGAKGVLSVNSIIAVDPADLVNMYVFRFDDPEHKLRFG